MSPDFSFMRIATNKFSDMALFWHRELDGIYGPDETTAMLAIAAEHYLGWSRNDLSLKAGANLNQSDVILIYDCAKALKEGQPLQYILGEAWFLNLGFKVGPQVLIPRPETEELVDSVLKEEAAARSFLDIGTGSGCIPISIKHYLPNAEVKACDISADALRLATENAKRHHTTIEFILTDALNTGKLKTDIGSVAEVIISNPPYIQETEKENMSGNVLAHEPHTALFVEGNDAILFYRRIIDAAEAMLLPGGRLYFELNPLTAEAVKQYASDSGLFQEVILRNDMSGKVRFLKARKKK